MAESPNEPIDEPFRGPLVHALTRRTGRRTLATVTLGSGVALLDSTVVNVGLRTIGADLDAGLVALQWVVTGYLLSLSSLILVGGALGDRLGRRRVYVVGVAGFAVASLLCAAAQDPAQLVAFRVVQGVFAALLTPGSLAILQASFRRDDRAWAIGTWAGVSGLATALGPLVGGLLLEHAGWRWIFAVNVPLCAVVLWLARGVPESRDEQAEGRFDVFGAASGVVVLACVTTALTSWRSLPLWVLVPLVVLAAVAGTAFVVRERRPDAMAPLGLFASRIFSAANAMTFVVYGALGALMLLLVLQLQVVAGYGPLAAGLATLPTTIAMLLLSSRFAVIAQHTGPRLPMAVGPLVCALGVLLLRGADGGASYWVEVFPGITVFSLGLAALVSPLTAAVLAAAPDRYAGVASGINNAVARTGSLLAVAAIPALAGLAGDDYADPAVLAGGYRHAMMICAGLLVAGGLVSWWGVPAGPNQPFNRNKERS